MVVGVRASALVRRPRTINHAVRSMNNVDVNGVRAVGQNGMRTRRNPVAHILTPDVIHSRQLMRASGRFQSMRWRRRHATSRLIDSSRLAVGMIVLALTACTPSHDKPEQAVFGTWRVSGSLCPGECALTQPAADAWRGRTASYLDTIAGFPDNSCTNPRYNIGHWTAEGRYGGVRLIDLGIKEDSALVVEIRCPTKPAIGNDVRWQAPGAFLLLKDHNHLFAIWEGVFFELTRTSG